MKAFQLLEHGWPGRFALREVADPEAGDGEVVVRVRACGLNRLDLWAEKGALPIPLTLPRTLGCEISGDVVAAGNGANNWRPGDRVAIQSNLFCGHCEFCLRGRESLCLNGVLLGVERDGGFAEQVVAPARTLVRLPENVDFTSSAALTLAGSTAMHMLTQRTTVQQGDWVLVIAGASGVGSAAIQIARCLGAYVVATGSTEAKRAFARELGAHHAVDITRPEWPREVRRLTDKRGVDVVVEHVGGEVLVQAFSCLARGGRVVTCGATGGREIDFNLWPFFVKEHALIGSYGRNRADMEAVLRWASEGKIKAMIDRTMLLSELPAAFEALRSRSVRGKIVVCPS